MRVYCLLWQQGIHHTCPLHEHEQWGYCYYINLLLMSGTWFTMHFSIFNPILKFYLIIRFQWLTGHCHKDQQFSIFLRQKLLHGFWRLVNISPFNHFWVYYPFNTHTFHLIAELWGECTKANGYAALINSVTEVWISSHCDLKWGPVYVPESLLKALCQQERDVWTRIGRCRDHRDWIFAV